MKHFQYKIYKAVYDDMISGKKTIEFRLLNEKSENIKIGDEIKFIVLDKDDKFVLVEVINKYIYDSVEDLWNHKEILTNNILNYSKTEFINAFYEIFGREKVDSSKVVGIEFRLKGFN